MIANEATRKFQLLRRLSSSSLSMNDFSIEVHQVESASVPPDEQPTSKFKFERSIKPTPNRERYLEILRRMTPGERLAKAFELSETGKQLMLAGLRHQFPNASEPEIRRMYLEGIALCHNRNY